MQRISALFILMGLSIGLNAEEENIQNPYLLYNQKYIHSKNIETGFADPEIDLLHYDIEQNLKKLQAVLKNEASSGEKDENKITMQVLAGEVNKPFHGHFIYDGEIHLFTNGDYSKLNKVVVRFVKTRIDFTTEEFVSEKRELVNSTPNYPEKVDSEKPDTDFDSNADITVVYSLRDDDEKPFEQKEKISVEEIPFYEEKMHVVRAYRRYLRVAAYRLQDRAEAVERQRRLQIRNMVNMR